MTTLPTWVISCNTFISMTGAIPYREMRTSP